MPQWSRAQALGFQILKKLGGGGHKSSEGGILCGGWNIINWINEFVKAVSSLSDRDTRHSFFRMDPYTRYVRRSRAWNEGAVSPKLYIGRLPPLLVSILSFEELLEKYQVA